MIEPYSERWVANVLKDVVESTVKLGMPWFDSKAAASRYAGWVEINAMVGREAVATAMHGIVRTCQVGPHNLIRAGKARA